MNLPPSRLKSQPGRSRRRLALLPLPVVAAALAIAGCGNDVPPNAVAKVGDETITKAEFTHWLGAAARGQQAPGEESAKPVVPDPPSYAKCVAARRKQRTPKGAKKPTEKQLKDQCRQQYESLRDQVMQFLISAEWIQQEAEQRDITATAQEVEKRFADQKKQSFPDDKAYKEFLKTSGMTEDDLKFRVKLDVLSNEVRRAIVKGKGDVTDADVKEYYEKNKRRFGQPERRDLAVVLTKTESKANQAKKALEDGASFKRVAKRFSIDQASKNQGGKLPGIAKGQQEKALDDAVFKARRGQLTGPIKTQFGYYLFEVTKITPAKQQSLEQSKDTIKNLLKSEREQKALDAFIKDFQEKYRDETNCAKGYVVEDCKGAPKPKTETGPASGAPPGGAQQAPPPQGGQQPAPQGGAQPPPPPPPPSDGQR